MRSIEFWHGRDCHLPALCARGKHDFRGNFYEKRLFWRIRQRFWGIASSPHSALRARGRGEGGSFGVKNVRFDASGKSIAFFDLCFFLGTKSKSSMEFDSKTVVLSHPHIHARIQVQFVLKGGGGGLINPKYSLRRALLHTELKHIATVLQFQIQI